MLKAFIIGTILFTLCKQQTFAQPADTTHTIKKSLPAFLKGTFGDDYGEQYTINDTIWLQQPSLKYHIIICDTTEQYILVQNDKTNKTNGGLFTRIDYMNFTGMEPYHWGFCLTIYNANTLETAKATIIADRKNPKIGCNGFPFSRMKRL
ncbi:MAG: hypothetical protein E6H07_15415 [Bacteroidetes bacterium]|nr:MAG: hypothetical protein E6H07_15415 [Bacteroidota bacterium]